MSVQRSLIAPTAHPRLEDALRLKLQRRGETAGGMGSRSSFEQFVKNGFGRFIAQIGGKEKDEAGQ